MKYNSSARVNSSSSTFNAKLYSYYIAVSEPCNMKFITFRRLEFSRLSIRSIICVAHEGGFEYISYNITVYSSTCGA